MRRRLPFLSGLLSRFSARFSARLLALLFAGLLLLPFLALAVSGARADIGAALSHPLFLDALWLSLRTTTMTAVLTVALGTPLAWWLGRHPSRLTAALDTALDLPIIIPPAVVGVALLETFGRGGWLGAAGASVAFTEAAVVLAQLVVAAPFYIKSAAEAFRAIDDDTLLVARSLGASPWATLRHVALPMAMPGLAGGLAMSWARALGEFGATLLFAGNLSGRTQTLPLAIFTVLERDVRVAVVFSLALAAIGVLLVATLRGATVWRSRKSSAKGAS